MPNLILAQFGPTEVGGPGPKSSVIQPDKSLVEKLDALTVPVARDRLGSKDHLPTEAHCLAHLSLLESFLGLKCRVERLAEEQGMAPDAAWGRYLQQSVHKFTDWISSRVLSDNEENELTPVPQLEVLMMWHAFMLNPLKYAKFEQMANFKLPRQGIDWELLNRSIDQVTCEAYNSSAIIESLVSVENEPVSNLEYFRFATSATRNVAFPFNLEAAIQRQFGFTLKMAEFAWRHHQHATDTMRRAIDRYAKFFSLVAIEHGTSVVPTLDVDLAWHTHQLNPEKYRAYSVFTGGRVVNHDDTIGSEALIDAFAVTSAHFKAIFGENYNLCFCWACEIGRSGGELNLFDIERQIREEQHRRKEAGWTVGLRLAIPACNKCGTHPTRTCCMLGGGPRMLDGKCGNCGSDPCTCGGGGGSCRTNCTTTNCGSKCGSNCGSSCSGCGGD